MTVESNAMQTLDEKHHHTENCLKCAMAPICFPTPETDQALDLSQHFLSKQLNVSTGTKIIAESSPAEAIYAVTSGTFKLTATDHQGKEKIVGFRYPGEMIGEDAIYPQKYAYSAISLTNALLCKVELEPLKACSALVPSLQQGMITLLSRQGYLAHCEFQSLVAHRSAEHLLAAFLLNLYKRNPLEQEESPSHILTTDAAVELTMSRDNIANYLGLRRETLSRVLSKFKHENLINITGKVLVLNDIKKLTILAN